MIARAAVTAPNTSAHVPAAMRTALKGTEAGCLQHAGPRCLLFRADSLNAEVNRQENRPQGQGHVGRAHDRVVVLQLVRVRSRHGDDEGGDGGADDDRRRYSRCDGSACRNLHSDVRREATGYGSSRRGLLSHVSMMTLRPVIAPSSLAGSQVPGVAGRGEGGLVDLLVKIWEVRRVEVADAIVTSVVA
jgi:hypothetical protein